MFSTTQYTKGQGTSTLVTKNWKGQVTKIETLTVTEGTGSFYTYTVQVMGQESKSEWLDDMAGEAVARRFQASK